MLYSPNRNFYSLFYFIINHFWLCHFLLWIRGQILQSFKNHQMGSSDSKNQASSESINEAQIPGDPLINRLRSAFRFSFSKNSSKITHSFVFGGFSQQIIKNNASKLDTNNSPFCSILMKDSKAKQQILITCALISPIMALAAAQHICDQTGYVFQQKLTLICCASKKWTHTLITKIFALQDSTLALLVLDNPIWELGWCGLTYLQKSSQMSEIPLHSIRNHHQKKTKDADDSIPMIYQNIDRVYFSDLGNMRGKSLKESNSLVFQITQRKPYLIGVQNGLECQFFDINTLKDMQNKADVFLTDSKEKQFLKKIDIEQMEIQTTW